VPAAHEVLGIDQDADERELRAGYRRLAQIYHPDRYAQSTPEVRDEVERKMRDLNAAYATMLDTAAWDVVYDTSGWSNNRRAALTFALLEHGVAHSWDEIELTVARRHERLVDRLLRS
jgi:DnaJ-class molecular chaperone